MALQDRLEQQRQLAATAAASGGSEEVGYLWQRRKYLMLIGILAATVTYTAGLSPPGGDWPDNGNGHQAGNPVLWKTHHLRLEVFFCCNTTAFVASIVITLLLLNRKLSEGKHGLMALHGVMVVDLFALMAAFAAASSHSGATSIYISLLVVGVFIYVVLHSLVYLLSKFFKIDQMFDRWIAAVSACCGGRRPGRHHLSDGERENQSKLLILFAIFAATVAYLAVVGPPGGFFTANLGVFLAGDPMLNEHYWRRYLVFFFCNATAFVVSLIIIVMLLFTRKMHEGSFIRSQLLRVFTIVDLIGLMGAYVAGSCRTVPMSAILIALVCAVVVYIFLLFLLDVFASKLDGSQNMSPGRPEVAGGAVERMLEEDEQTLQKSRSILLLLAVLAASVAYQAGLSPPGGFWPDSSDGHVAGHPVLLSSRHARRYRAFYYCNSIAFAASLVIIIITQSNKFSYWRPALHSAMAFAMFGLIGAFAAGSSRDSETTAFVIFLIVPFFVYVVLHAFVSRFVCCGRGTFAGFVFRFVCCGRGTFAGHANNDDLKRRRKFLLLLATFGATVTYLAGLSPPGGFWTDDNGGHHAGDPVLQQELPTRYIVFFYCNATAFMASVAVVMLLVDKRLYEKTLRSFALGLIIVVDLFSLVGAYAAGSQRSDSLWFLDLALAVVVFLVVIFQIFFYKAATNIQYCGEGNEDSKGGASEGRLQSCDSVTTEGPQTNIEYSSSGEGHRPNGIGGAREGPGPQQNTGSGSTAEGIQPNIGDAHNQQRIGSNRTTSEVLQPNPNGGDGDSCQPNTDNGSSSEVHQANGIGGTRESRQPNTGTPDSPQRNGNGDRSTGEGRQPNTGSVDNPQRNGSGRDGSASESHLPNTTTTADQQPNFVSEEVYMTQKILMLIGILAAGAAYQAGMSPPGSFWGDDSNGHLAGDPVLLDESRARYLAFYYCNSISFVASIVVVFLVLQPTLSRHRSSLRVMKSVAILDLLGMLGAFAAGSTRSVESPGVVFSLVGAVLSYLVIHTTGLPFHGAAACCLDRIATLCNSLSVLPQSRINYAENQV